jgi:hypothetical protein
MTELVEVGEGNGREGKGRDSIDYSASMSFITSEHTQGRKTANRPVLRTT